MAKIVPAGTRWNNGNPISCVASSFSNEDINKIWEIVAEDFSPFDLNVTTDRSVYDTYIYDRGIMVIFTPTNTFPGGNCCGAAGFGSFNDILNDDPAFIWQSATAKLAADRCFS